VRLGPDRKPWGGGQGEKMFKCELGCPRIRRICDCYCGSGIVRDAVWIWVWV
jgi:hypothetical protein